jgi:hypothetical protein
MSADVVASTFYVRATDPTTGEHTAYECVGLVQAHAKAAELRMSGYKDVILSIASDKGSTPS